MITPISRGIARVVGEALGDHYYSDLVVESRCYESRLRGDPRAGPLRDIPLATYDHIVKSNLSRHSQRRRRKPALEWVMERQSVTTDKDSGITNDANLWATETMNNPKYPLELFLRVVTVGLETMKIVNWLPGLEID